MIEKTFPIAEQLFQQTLTQSQKLLDLLSQEADGLNNPASADYLAHVSHHKQETVSLLEQLTRQLNQVMATEKLNLVPADIDTYFEKASKAGLGPSSAPKLWLKTLNIAKKCQQLNEQNGASIDILFRHSQRALKILSGKALSATTYGPDGSTYSERNSQSIVSV